MPTPFELQAMQYLHGAGMPPPMASPGMDPSQAGATLRNSPTEAQKAAAAAANKPKPSAPPPTPAATPPIDPEVQAQQNVAQAYQHYQSLGKQVEGDNAPLEKMPGYTAPEYKPPAPLTMLGLALAGLLQHNAAPAFEATAKNEVDTSKENYARDTQRAQDEYKAKADAVTQDNSAATNRFGKEVTQLDAAGRLYESAVKNQTDLRRTIMVEDDHRQRRNDLLQHWTQQAQWQQNKLTQTMAFQTAQLARRDDDAMARAQVSLPLRMAALRARVDLASVQNQVRIGLSKIGNIALDKRATYRQQFNEIGKEAAGIAARQKADSAIVSSLFAAAHPDDPKVQAAQSDLTVGIPADNAKMVAKYGNLNIDTSGDDAEFQKLQDQSQAEFDALNSDPSYSGATSGGVTIEQSFTGMQPGGGSTTGSTSAAPAPPAPAPPKPPVHTPSGPAFYGRPLSYYKSIIDQTPAAERTAKFNALPLEIQHALGHV